MADGVQTTDVVHTTDDVHNPDVVHMNDDVSITTDGVQITHDVNITDDAHKTNVHITEDVHMTDDVHINDAVRFVLHEAQEARGKHSSVPLIKREFMNVETTESSHLSCPTSDSRVRVLQWNILAQGLCRCSDGFVLCPSAALEWSVRQNLILEELLTHAPDVLCLQEVDNFKHLSHHLLRAGYKGSFFPKPDSPCLYTKDSNGPDGCALFWNHHKLRLMARDNIVLEKNSSGKLTNQVAIVCRFQLQSKKGESSQEVVVSTTHLKSKCNYHRLRFDQGLFLEQWLQDHYQGYPLILCGDFNAEPTEKVIELFKKSSLGLCSTYTLLSKDCSEPSYTTWKVRGNCLGKHEEFCHTIDYVFFTPQFLTCQKILKFPSGQEIGEGRLPSYSYPSDHLSLVADFYLNQ